jgi:uncharacterized BrkB/YihY/UPF0761 family membrane protein
MADKKIETTEDIPGALTIKTSHYVIGALSLVTALSWNESINEAIKKVYTVPKDVIWANFLYSVIITVILICVIYMLPNTTKELPPNTQAAITHSENVETIKNMKDKVDNLQAQNHIMTFKINQVAQ